MQVYATLAQLTATTLLSSLALRGPQLAPAAESRVVRLGQKSGPRKLKELINCGREYGN